MAKDNVFGEAIDGLLKSLADQTKAAGGVLESITKFTAVTDKKTIDGAGVSLMGKNLFIEFESEEKAKAFYDQYGK